MSPFLRDRFEKLLFTDKAAVEKLAASALEGQDAKVLKKEYAHTYRFIMPVSEP